MLNRSGMVNFIPFTLTRTRENHSWCFSWPVKVFRNASTYVESFFQKLWTRSRFRPSNHVESIGHGHFHTIHANENSRKSLLMLRMAGHFFQKCQHLSRIVFSKTLKRSRFRPSNHVESIGHGQFYTIHANENSRKSLLMPLMRKQSFQKCQLLRRKHMWFSQLYRFYRLYRLYRVWRLYRLYRFYSRATQKTANIHTTHKGAPPPSVPSARLFVCVLWTLAAFCVAQV